MKHHEQPRLPEQPRQQKPRTKTPFTPKKFINHFDKFPPILREMVMEAMSDEEHKEEYGSYVISPLHKAFYWDENLCLSDHDFWNAVNEDAIHHKIWPECA